MMTFGPGETGVAPKWPARYLRIYGFIFSLFTKPPLQAF
jgi:hypothetical protein